MLSGIESVLTVDVPADVSGGQFEGVVDALQHSLQLLLLGDLRLCHLGHVQLLALQLLCSTGVHMKHPEVSGRSSSRGDSKSSDRWLLTEQLLQHLSIVQVLGQVLHDDPLSHQDVVDPVNQHLCRNKKKKEKLFGGLLLPTSRAAVAQG